MSAFHLVRASAPAAMPIGEPENGDPWTLELIDGRWIVTFEHCEEDFIGDGIGTIGRADGLDSFLAFLTYLDTPIRVTSNGRDAPTIEILDT